MNNEGRLIPPWPVFSSEEVKASSEVLRSGQVNYWTGDQGKLFEKEFADNIGVNHAIALANGTLALDLALKGLGISSGHEVIVTPRSFIASVSCVVNAGATPVFADIDNVSGNINADTITKVITPKTKAIICVHLAGWPCEMDDIMELASEHNLFVIEDCAQAHGSTYKGNKVGSIGHVGAWSFCQDKIMSTGGEGGMVTTNDKSLWKNMWAYKDHGKNYDSINNKELSPGFKWLHDSFGSNFRMTEFQSSIGRIQLKKLDEWSRIRNKNAKQLKEVCDRYSDMLYTPTCNNYSHHAYYKFYTYINPSAVGKGWSRDRIIEELNSEGVPSFSGSCSEIYLEKAFEDVSSKPKKRLPVAKMLGENSLVFLVHPTLSCEDLDFISSKMDKIFNEAKR
tara:strand:- start:4831 stop:6015 length:1185 start_codon:yes stop_codon:yes gene_type:complete